MSAYHNQTNIAPGTLFSGGGNFPSDIVCNSLSASNGIVASNAITSKGPLTWSIYNSGATSVSLTGLMDNKATRQPTLTQTDLTTPSLLQVNSLCAVGGSVGSGIATYGSSGVGEPYIFTSYNASNVDILKTANNFVKMSHISSINNAGSNLNITALVSTLAVVYPGCVS